MVGHNTPGVGFLPRAFVVLKTGYEATAEDVNNFVGQRVADTDRYRQTRDTIPEWRGGQRQ